MRAILSQMDWVTIAEISVGILVAGVVVLALYAVVALIVYMSS